MIDEVLTELPKVIVGQSGIDQQELVVKKLVELPPDSSDSLRAKSELLLHDLGTGSNALKLETVLDAMTKRGQDITDLASRAIFAPGLAEREMFVDLLVIASPEAAVTPLCRALREFDDESDPDGFLRQRILKRLGTLKSQEVIDDIVQVLKTSEDDRVRIEAVIALGNLGAKSAESALIERLEVDNHPDVVAESVNLLGNWGVSAARPAIESLAKSEWASRSDEVRHATEAALKKLS